MAEKTLVVLLISKQTIPNVLFLKWYFKNHLQFEFVDVLCISTKEMEKNKKSECIFNALQNFEKHMVLKTILETDESDLEKTGEVLKKFFENNSYDNTAVNITGGTKMMSIAAYIFFKEKSNTEIYYQPINKSLRKIYPDLHCYEIEELLFLDEYLKATGIQYTADNNCVKSEECNKTVFGSVVGQNYDLIKYMVKLQNESYFKNLFGRKSEVDFTSIAEEKFPGDNPERRRSDICDLITLFGFNPQKFTRRQLKYITGGWFEEYTYQTIKKQYNIKDNNIALNVKIEVNNVSNELDVVYLDAENILHIVECKSFIDDESKLIADTLYKAQALKSKFGLSVKSHLYTKSTVNKNSIIKRAADFDIDITDGAFI